MRLHFFGLLPAEYRRNIIAFRAKGSQEVPVIRTDKGTIPGFDA
jgi:hypothetical protein